MVLGLSSKNRRGSSIQVDYLIHIHDIKPWPPSQSLRSLRSVVIQWENGDRNSGSTNVVAPSLGSVIGEGKIEFNESFRLPMTLLKDVSARNKDGDVFLKNVLEFNLYEPRREKAHQLLATATVDLADYGIVKDSLSLTAPMNSKRSYRNTSQPVLFFTIQPVDRSRGSSSSKINTKDEVKNAGESVSALMNEEYYEEAEIASITDDDISSHSSLTVSSTTLESNGGFSVRTEEEEQERVTKSSKGNGHESSQTVSEGRHGEIANETPVRSSSVDLSSVFSLPVDAPDSAPNTSVSGLEDCANVFMSNTVEDTVTESSNLVSVSPQMSGESKSMSFQNNDYSENVSPRASEHSQDLISDQESESRVGRSRKVKSVRSTLDSARSNSRLSLSNERKEAKVYPKGTCDTTLESKVKDLESKVKKLEGELREAAAIEAALYSVVAEHGSSSSKVHAPARRLLRLYLHACKDSHLSRRANAAKSAVSGLVLVAKACGNDVPRLTFWLSNTIVLRTIISDTNGEEELPVSAGPGPRKQSLRWKDSPLNKKNIKSAVNKSFGAWDDPVTFITALEKVESWIFSRVIESIWWQTLTPRMQSSAASTAALDKANGSASTKSFGRSPSSMNQEQGDFSLELWKKAFRDAHERLCPLRASGHECGCLPVPARLIMEQCVTRLDVAMFNAILRDFDDNFPTDPVSDPIADSRVLPIPSGKSSFGSGAQLKTLIGNWSRWLTDLFGIDDDDDNSDDERHDGSFKSFNLLKALSDLMMLPKDMLLNSAVRKEVCPMFGAPLIKRVLDNFVPDEFCPDPVPNAVLEALESEEELEEAGKALITSFPYTAPPPVYSPPSGASISSTIRDFGQIQSPQLSRIRSSVTRKAYTSDDELDELSSPLAVVVLQQTGSKKVNGGVDDTVRYELLRECWMNGD